MNRSNLPATIRIEITIYLQHARVCARDDHARARGHGCRIPCQHKPYLRHRDDYGCDLKKTICNILVMRMSNALFGNWISTYHDQKYIARLRGSAHALRVQPWPYIPSADHACLRCMIL